MNIDQAISSILAEYLQFLNPSSRIFILYITSAVVLALISYWQVERLHAAEERAHGKEPPRSKGFLAFVFDPKVWLHPSSKQDFKYFAVNALVYYGLLVQFMVGTEFFSHFFIDKAQAAFGEPTAPILTGGWAIALYTLVAVLAFDFGVFIMHWLFHRIPVFWQFHKVHHSAEQLNPLTLFRMHPLDLAMTSLSVMFFQALAFAGFFYLSGSTPEPYTIFGLNIILFFFYLAGYNLRHSHIWLNFPKWLNHILVSPAQHQIHHSSNPKHFDRNMGLIFSFWDQLFGTHYNPTEREELKYGLSRKEPNPFKSVGEMYTKPFVWSWAIIIKKGGMSSSNGRSLIYASATVTLIALMLMKTLHVDEAPLPDLRLEKLTWTQVDGAMKRGYDEVIIPTGGTEQNGPFVILGKHNLIADHTTLRIAKRVGKTLIAPVMAYVPEGEYEPKVTHHMTYPGTLSLPEPVFESVLEATAKSLKAHGFKRIYIVGESGDSQAAQIRLAERLDAQWKGEGVRVVNIGDYYYENGQMQYLLDQGYSKKEIGFHAGMRDGSEVMALDENGVMLEYANRSRTERDGFSGNLGMASAKIGKKMLSMKVDAAVKEIQKLRTQWADDGTKADKLAVLEMGGK